MRRRSVVALLALLVVGSGASAAAPDDEDQVRQVFVAYKKALMEGDGDVAAALVDTGTLDYFEAIKGLSLEGREDEIRGRPFIDRLLIVTIRHELDPSLLRGMELRDLLRHAIDAGWIARSSIAQLDIGDVSVEGDEATGVALAGAMAASSDPDAEPLFYRFVREDGVWRFRFASLVASLNRIVTDFARQMGAAEDDLIFMLVQTLSGRQVLPEIWDAPVGPEGAAGSAEAPRSQ